MKHLLNFALSMTLIFTVVSCGDSGDTNADSSFYNKFVNSKNGVEFKEPNKIQNNQGGFNQQSQSEILLTLDTNGTYHLRSSIPENVQISNGKKELEGDRGTWTIKSGGKLSLSNGAEADVQGLLGFNTNNSDRSFTLTFQEPVRIKMVQSTNSGFGFSGGTITSYTTVDFTLQGSTSVSR